jgi:hypothetical protein
MDADNGKKVASREKIRSWKTGFKLPARAATKALSFSTQLHRPALHGKTKRIS